MSKPDTITIDEVKYVRADSVKTIKPVFEGDFQPFEIGAVYFIRTVTMIDVGRVVAASDKFVILEDAAWVADTGRFANALKDWNFKEVEPFPNGYVGIPVSAIIDFCKGKEVLRTQK